MQLALFLANTLLQFRFRSQSDSKTCVPRRVKIFTVKEGRKILWFKERQGGSPICVNCDCYLLAYKCLYLNSFTSKKNWILEFLLMLVPHAGFILGLISSNLQMVVAVWSRAKNLFVSYQCSTLLLFEGPLHRIWKFALTLHVQDCSFLDSGHIFHAGHASVHVREPVRAWHAGDDAGGAPGHHPGGVRRPGEEEPVRGAPWRHGAGVCVHPRQPVRVPAGVIR